MLFIDPCSESQFYSSLEWIFLLWIVVGFETLENLGQLKHIFGEISYVVYLLIFLHLQTIKENFEFQFLLLFEICGQC